MSIRSVFLCALLSIGGVSAQTVEVGPVSGYLHLSKKPLGSLNETAADDDTAVAGKKAAYGIRAAWNSKGYYGIEGGYVRSGARIDSKIVPSGETEKVAQSGTISLHQIFLSGLCYFMPKGSWWRPFVMAGPVVQVWSDPGMTDWTAGNSKQVGLQYGGGIKFRLSRAVLRVDGYEVLSGAPYNLKYGASEDETASRTPGLFRQFAVTAGIGFTF